MNELLIDVGTSYFKYLCLDSSSRTLVREGRVPGPAARASTPLRDEIDPWALIETFKSIVGRIGAQHGQIASIRMSTQMHSFLLAKPDGTPLTPVITWRDRRPLESPFREAVYHRIRETNGPGASAGQVLRPNLPVVKLLHLQQEDPELFLDGPVLLHSVGSFINAHLTGRHFTHITNAAPLGLLNVVSSSWDTGRIGDIGLPNVRLPDVYREVKPVAKDGVSGAVIFPDVGDHQAAYFGCVNDSAPPPLMVSAGTAGLVSIASEHFQVGPGTEARPFFGGAFLLTVTGLPGGEKLGTDAAGEILSAARRLPRPSSKELWVTGGAAPRNRLLWEAVAKELGMEGVRVEERDASIMGLQRLADEYALSTKEVMT